MIYTKRTKHRHKCYACGKLIDDGATVTMRRVTKEKYYPVRGLMQFASYQFAHTDC